ncbi:redoxin domain-containing protein [Candidatus Uhrbacteria bacterium]|nr:redoxin domain-containing protein [Candidatus Uhrbacteria bacterium]
MKLVDLSVQNAGKSRLPILADAMPPFQGISRWWNTDNNEALTPEKLRGKVVMIDFWTYSCINCIRTQPFMRKIWETYKDDGLVIVGVHTPEFAFEKVPENVEQALKKAELEYPIALDAEYKTWNAYGNRYWPAAYIFDREGRLRFTHFGEGEYAEQEDVIRELLSEGTVLTDEPTGSNPVPDFKKTITHETYFGTGRFENFANRDELRPDQAHAYTLRETQRDQWSIGGQWKLTPEYAAGLSAGSKFRMNVESDAMHLVLGSMNGSQRIRINIDGKTVETITVTDKALYTVAKFPEAGRHTVEIELLDGTVEFYAATFGMIMSNACDLGRLAVNQEFDLGGNSCTP